MYLIYYQFSVCSILEEFDREMEQTESRLQTLTKRVNKAIAKSSGEIPDSPYFICI